MSEKIASRYRSRWRRELRAPGRLTGAALCLALCILAALPRDAAGATNHAESGKNVYTTALQRLARQSEFQMAETLSSHAVDVGVGEAALNHVIAYQLWYASPDRTAVVEHERGGPVPGVDEEVVTVGRRRCTIEDPRPTLVKVSWTCRTVSPVSILSYLEAYLLGSGVDDIRFVASSRAAILAGTKRSSIVAQVSGRGRPGCMAFTAAERTAYRPIDTGETFQGMLVVDRQSGLPRTFTATTWRGKMITEEENVVFAPSTWKSIRLPRTEWRGNMSRLR
ncbi:MAG: hypothetical protein M3Z66_21905 [Chloroflexota bacterium]|nr:hypothetical protein [Chloroflexota bacterium]